MNKFTLGAVAGMTTLLIAVPLAAQFAGAQSASSLSYKGYMKSGTMTQEQVQEMITHTDDMLKNIDAITAAHKTAMQAHKAALQAALSLTDDTARAEAVKKAHDDMRTSMQKAMESLNIDGKFMMMRGPGHMGGKMKMRGMAKIDLAEKLGMTQDELKAAIDSGKTIEQIAEEKGVELPARPAGGMFFKHMKGPMMNEMNEMNEVGTEVAPN